MARTPRKPAAPKALKALKVAAPEAVSNEAAARGYGSSTDNPSEHQSGGGDPAAPDGGAKGAQPQTDGGLIAQPPVETSDQNGPEPAASPATKDGGGAASIAPPAAPLSDEALTRVSVRTRHRVHSPYRRGPGSGWTHVASEVWVSADVLETLRADRHLIVEVLG